MAELKAEAGRGTVDEEYRDLKGRGCVWSCANNEGRMLFRSRHGGSA